MQAQESLPLRKPPHSDVVVLVILQAKRLEHMEGLGFRVRRARRARRARRPKRLKHMKQVIYFSPPKRTPGIYTHKYLNTVTL